MITVKVTQEDIQTGAKDNCYRCPIALALNRALKKPVTCWTYTYTIHNISYTLPSVVSRFIVGFDGGDLVKPFEFQIESPQESV